jgi:hypothetical protein
MRILLCRNLDSHSNTEDDSISLGYGAMSIGKCQYYIPTDAASYSRRNESSRILLSETKEL